MPAEFVPCYDQDFLEMSEVPLKAREGIVKRAGTMQYDEILAWAHGLTALTPNRETRLLHLFLLTKLQSKYEELGHQVQEANER